MDAPFCQTFNRLWLEGLDSEVGGWYQETKKPRTQEPKNPSGMALKLLDIVNKHGLSVLA